MNKGNLTVLLLLLLALPAFAGQPHIDSGATAWMLTSTALVLLMIPGLALFYGGLVRSKNVLGTMMHSFAAMGIMSVLWVALGYAMSFGHNVLGGWFGWNGNYFFLKGIDTSVLQADIPEYVFSMFQGKFAIITPALIAGAFAERVSFKGYVLFIALWGILVYNPLCHWVWAADGFLFKLGTIDFAGGTVVHISSGISGLVAALYLGSRRGYPKTTISPNNLVNTMLGVGLLWVGWFGFNAGSSISSGLSTARALTATQIAAASGAITWMIIEAVHQKKSTALGFASGILAGLVGITPAAGTVQPYGAMAIGGIAATVCYLAIILKNRLGYDDSLDVFGIHGIGGITGALALTFFIRKSWIEKTTNALAAKGIAWSTMYQFGIQLTAVSVAIAYAGIATFVLIHIVNRITGFRLSAQEEMAGLDHSCHGERAYGMLNAN